MPLLNVGRRGILRAALVTGAVLLIPLWGNTYVEGWNWPWAAFVRIGAFIFLFALTYQIAVYREKTSTMRPLTYRIALGIALITTFVVMFSNFVLAADANTVNFLFLLVVPVGVVGAAIARFRARGMAFVMLAMTIAMLLVPLLALLVWNTGVAPGAVPIIGLNGVWTVLFAASALLFRRAARTQQRPPAPVE